MKNLKNTTYLDYISGFIFTLFFISLSIIITINFKPLYYMDINVLNIEEQSSLNKDEIIDNYNALINFLSPFHKEELKLPSLPSSTEGLHHFNDVKDIFIFIYYIFIITMIICIGIIIYKYKQNDYRYLMVTTITSIILPLFAGIIIAINFEKAFIIFHKIFFSNDYWLFDPDTDPVINILPSEYFMHSAIFIIILMLFFTLISYIIYKKSKPKGIKYRKINDLKL